MYMSVSTMEFPEVCEYPDSDKYLVKSTNQKMMVSGCSTSGAKASIIGKANREVGNVAYRIGRSDARFAQTAGMLLALKVCYERLTDIANFILCRSTGSRSSHRK
jgi:hypothetical protein